MHNFLAFVTLVCNARCNILTLAFLLHDTTIVMPLFDDLSKHGLLMSVDLQQKQYVVYDLLSHHVQSQEEVINGALCG